tara:strand:- start:19058 stop:19732 length:675 start_codon:yes stop_codon:yes gene_type:complete
MAEITIRNKELLATLDGFVEEMFSKSTYNDPSCYTYRTEADMELGEYFCSQEYLDECLARSPELVGPPDRYFAIPIAALVRKHPDDWKDYMQKVKYDFAADLGAHTSALLSYYPPKGFVGWHTNYDANAYQVLFTWSKDGNGFFRYRNADGTITTEQDKPGWQARHYYFGAENEPDDHLWHSAYAGCERITLAYKFVNGDKSDIDKDRGARLVRDLLIEDIESE